LLNPLDYRVDLNHDFYIYFLKGNIGRRFRGLIFHRRDNIPHYIAEFGFPPFGYVMTDKGFGPDSRFFDITYFMKYGYEDRMNFNLELNELSNPSWKPLDFGTGEYEYGFAFGTDVSMHQKIVK